MFKIIHTAVTILGHFSFWIIPSLSRIPMCTHRPQGVIVVGIYMSSNNYFIIIILKQRGVMQTNSLADV